MSANQTKGQMQGGPGNVRGKGGKGSGAKPPNGHYRPWPGGKPKPLGLHQNGAKGTGGSC